MSEFPTGQYVKDQLNYVQHLREQAIKANDVDKTVGVSDFMVGCYFRLGYDTLFRKYWNGQRHKLDWQGLEKIVDLNETSGMFEHKPLKKAGWGQ